MKAKYIDKQLPTNLPTSSLDAFRQDLQLRGFTPNTVSRIYGNTRRYFLWAQERSLEPEKGLKEELTILP